MLLEVQDLLKVELKGDNLMGFRNDWDFTLGGLETIPSEDINWTNQLS